LAVPPSYLVATVAGGNSAGDGGLATSAAIYGPVGVWQDSVGTLFIVESAGHRVRAVSVAGIISTVAGTGETSPYPTDPSGDNGPVRPLPSYFIIFLSLFFSLSGNFRHSPWSPILVWRHRWEFVHRRH
jgi:hypothetical protein